MIEIIREEDFERTGRKELPKDIKQMGKPDIGERIYVENQVYEFLHPYDSINEKSAYILLGRFENYAGRQCTFVEAAIRLEEMEFDGELPLWNDRTWAYVYRQLRQEHDSMAIVGWALDVKGMLPNLTVRVETLHQNNFGGAHQILFLMDSLECEETFYGSRNGHLYRREGFYIYYDRNISEGMSRTPQSDMPVKESGIEREMWDMADKQESALYSNTAGLQQKTDAGKERYTERESVAERENDSEDKWYTEHTGRNVNGIRDAEPTAENIIWEQREERDRKSAAENRGSYRRQMLEREETAQTPSYASSFLLLVVVCAFGITAYANYQKMNAMQETLAQMNGTQISGEEIPGTEQTGINVESVAGNVSKEGQAEVQTGQDAAAQTGEPGADDVAASEQGDRQDVVQPGANGDTSSQPGEASQSSQGAAQNTAQSEETEKAASETSGTQDVAASGQGSQPDTAQPGANGDTEVQNAVSEAQTYLAQGYYVVQKGDSLVGICKKIYQTTAMMDKLCEVNGIEDENAIYAGQQLALPN